MVSSCLLLEARRLKLWPNYQIATCIVLQITWPQNTEARMGPGLQFTTGLRTGPLS